MAAKRPSLGRGLGALLSEITPIVAANPPASATISTAATKPLDGELRQLPVEILQRGKYQPRKDIEPEALNDLANSIRTQGIIQPIIVRKLAQGGNYEIIAGERRWRAAQLAGLSDIPAIVRNISDEAAMALALIENIQRQDLNPIEEAFALHRLLEEFGLTHQQIADAVGKSRATVTNLLRLLGLNSEVRVLVEQRRIEMGHARALLALVGATQTQIAEDIAAKGLSVRETEMIVRKLLSQSTSGERLAPSKKTENPNIWHLERELSDKLGAVVNVDQGVKGKGKLIIHFHSADELEGILRRIR
jgi:ParB family chromosome partitioning protein